MNKTRELLAAKRLTVREIDVSMLIAQGLSNKEIGNTLSIAEVTVKFHLMNIFRKMSITNRAQLIIACLSGKDSISIS